MQRLSYKIMISGGGTGGHIFPAIAIANAFTKRHSNAEVLFVGALGKMEMEKVPANGYKIEGLWISGIQRSLSFKNLMVPIKLILSLFKAIKIIKRFEPDIVVGVGGFASGPLVYVASHINVPTLIQEQNSYAGVTNKLVAKSVDKICVAYDGMDKYFPGNKIVKTGNPIREAIQNARGKRNEANEFFQLDASKLTVLAVGGSLGARTINESLLANLDVLAKQDIQLIWQTGKPFYERAKKAIEDGGYGFVKVYDFVNQMDLGYAAADIVVSRAGALAIAELCATEKASILVPFPFASEDHQTKNAMALVQKDAAIHIADKDAGVQLIPELIKLIGDKDKIEKLQINIAKLAMVDAAERIVDEIDKLIKA